MKNITGIKYYSFFAIVFFGAVSYSQSTETLKIKLDKLQNAKGRIESTIIDINLKIEEVKLKFMHESFQ